MRTLRPRRGAQLARGRVARQIPAGRVGLAENPGQAARGVCEGLSAPDCERMSSPHVRPGRSGRRGACHGPGRRQIPPPATTH